MREIKFRGWCEKDSEWRHGFYITNGIVHEIDTMLKSGSFYASRVDAESVGQYTGMKDKNGVEIYEGDIVRKSGKHYPVAYTWNEFAIEDYDNGDYCHGMDSAYHNWGSFEVIGNIHENPELLK